MESVTWIEQGNALLASMDIPFHSLDLLMVAVMASLWCVFELVHHDELRIEAAAQATATTPATIRDR